jgi:hypothetical protein
MRLNEASKGAVKDVLSGFLRLCVQNGELPAVLITVPEDEMDDGFAIYVVNAKISNSDMVGFLRKAADEIEEGGVVKTIVDCP